MKKKIPLLLVVIGILAICYGGGQIRDTNQKQNQALIDARQLVLESSAAETDPDQLIKELKKKNGPIGILEIPRLNKELPIIKGTDEDDLERGVGHYDGTVLPGENDQILLSGHRDTVFRRLGELEKKDELVVKMPYGTYTYVITDTEIVDADNHTVIRSTAPDEVLTLSTCYPFQYVGNAPKRYIIYARPLSK